MIMVFFEALRSAFGFLVVLGLVYLAGSLVYHSDERWYR